MCGVLRATACLRPMAFPFGACRTKTATSRGRAGVFNMKNTDSIFALLWSITTIAIFVLIVLKSSNGSEVHQDVMFMMAANALSVLYSIRSKLK